MFFHVELGSSRARVELLSFLSVKSLQHLESLRARRLRPPVKRFVTEQFHGIAANVLQML